MVVLVAAAGLGRWLVPWVRGAWRARQRSEPAAFRRALAAVRGRDAAAALAAVMEWLDRLDPGFRPARLDLFLAAHGDGRSRAAAESLARCLATGDGIADASALASGLKRAHRRCLGVRARRRRAADLLPELNRRA